MKLLTAAEMTSLDRQATEHYGIPSLTLMENAGRLVAEAAADMLGDLRHRRIIVFCGKGNNGGDGLVAARHLSRKGAEVGLYILGSFQDLKADPASNLQAAGRAGLNIVAVSDSEALSQAGTAARDAALVIDALLGTGFTPPLHGLYAEAVKCMNGLGLPILAVDTPSGLSSDSGHLPELAVNAARTVTFGLPKVGQFLFPAAQAYGTLYLGDIGFPLSLQESAPASHHLITREYVRPLLPPRPRTSHKGMFGHTLLLAGSWGLAGAAILAARGALRSGSGLVTVALPESQSTPVLDSLPEAMILPLPETGRGTSGEQASETVLEALPGKNVMALGPGLSRHPETVRLIRDLIPHVRLPLVIDADGLNALADSPSILLESRSEVVITPHPGELARLLSLTSAEVQENRIDLSQEFSKKYGVIVVLKGAATVVATPAGQIFINPTGNPGMAAAGMGDVLTGVIAAFIAQGLSILDAAVAGAFLHGGAGDLAAAQTGPWGFLAGEVADLIPAVLRDLHSERRHEETSRRDLQLLRP
jgi:NAD(P)H-hydrate epimerase